MNNFLTAYLPKSRPSKETHSSFGVAMVERSWSGDYRYGFNGKEKEADMSVGDYDFGERIFDSRLALWLSIDPFLDKYPYISAYSAMMSNPIIYLDPDGRRIYYVNSSGERIRITRSTLKLIDNKELREAIEMDVCTKMGRKNFNHFARSSKIDMYLGTASQKSRTISLDEWNCEKPEDVLGSCVEASTIDVRYTFSINPHSSLFDRFIQKPAGYHQIGGAQLRQGFDVKDFGIVLFTEGLERNANNGMNWNNAVTAFHEFLHGILSGTEEAQHEAMGVKYENGREMVIKGGEMYNFMKALENHFGHEIKQLERQIKRLRKSSDMSIQHNKDKLSSLKGRRDYYHDQRSGLKDHLKEHTTSESNKK